MITLALGIILILVALTEAWVAIFFFATNSGNQIRKVFALLTISIALWAIANGVTAINQSISLELASRFAYAFASILVIALFHFSLIFPYPYIILDRVHFFLLYFPAVIFVYLSLFSKSIVSSFSPGGLNGVVGLGDAYYLFVVYIVGYIFASLIILLRKYRKADGIHKWQLKNFLIGTLITAAVALNTNLVLPLFGIGTLGTIGPLATLSWLFAVYRIIQRK